jgi:excinuclease ABC subunit C
MFDWHQRLETLPSAPGIYIMKDAEGHILYIGKARDLRRRVRQYFQESGDPRPFVRQLPDLLADIDILLTGSEKEALLLEASMIREHQPRFNILLKEERRYLYLCIDHSREYPKLEVVRRSARLPQKHPQETLFGPYLSGYAVRQTKSLIDQWFRLRSCEDREFRNRARPCLEYQIKRCDAPCCLPVSTEDYAAHIAAVSLFLEGKHLELERELQTRMWQAAECQKYEDAARYRDQINAIKQMISEREQWHTRDLLDRDIFGLFREGPLVEIQLLTIRQGQLSGGRSFSFSQQEFGDSEILERFLSAYYLRDHIPIPHIVCLPTHIEGQMQLAEILSERSSKIVAITAYNNLDPDKAVDNAAEPECTAESPVLEIAKSELAVESPLSLNAGATSQADGEVADWQRERKLVQLANQNAQQSFFEKQKHQKTSEKLLQQLQQRLGLERCPYRIECIDNSHLQGNYAVSAIAVYEGGIPNRSAYRRYHIKQAPAGDDFAAMNEILSRRFRRALREQTDLPDLLIVDGGRGQLQIALEVLRELKLDQIPTIAIAKKKDSRPDSQDAYDRIILPQQKNPLLITSRYRELLLIAQIRDQAHQTALEFHQKIRNKDSIQSLLDQIPGIGHKRKRTLLQHFGSVEQIRKAKPEDIANIPGISHTLAQDIADFLSKTMKIL